VSETTTKQPPRGTAIRAANPDDATTEARAAVKRDAERRNSPEANQKSAGPVHKFKLKYGEFEDTIEVEHRHPGQAEIEARAQFNDKLPKKMRRPNPREVQVQAL